MIIKEITSMKDYHGNGVLSPTYIGTRYWELVDEGFKLVRDQIPSDSIPITTGFIWTWDEMLKGCERYRKLHFITILFDVITDETAFMELL